jgi:hypothetical protein
MSWRCAFPILGLSTLFLLAMSCSGCSRAGSADDPERQHMVNVAKLAGEYNLAHKKFPASLDELKKWAVQEGKAGEGDFVSTRDKEPYILSSGMAGLQLYEQKGKNGKCYVYMWGGIHEDTQERVADQAKRLSGVSQGQGAPAGRKNK